MNKNPNYPRGKAFAVIKVAKFNENREISAKNAVCNSRSSRHASVLR